MKVSVCMITYNHSDFISQALESVLLQKVNFQYEIIIGDDCSNDSTREILLEYQSKYPNLIKLIFNKFNVGPTKNFANVLKNASGKYVSILEGDDYWTSTNKLQRQVDILDKKNDIAICYHAVQVVDRYDKSKKLILPIRKFRKEVSTLIDLICNYSFMATCSIVFRNKLFDYFPDVFFTSRWMCDWPLNVLNAEHGDIYYCDEIMGSYRQQSSSDAWTSKGFDLILLTQIEICQKFDSYFEYKYSYFLNKNIEAWCRDLSKYYLTRYQYRSALSYYAKSCRTINYFHSLFLWCFVIFPKYTLIGIARSLYNLLNNFRNAFRVLK